MKAKISRFACLAAAAMSAAVAQNSQRGPNYKPAAGYVPDAETAKVIAVAVWTSIYGAKSIQSEKPCQARLQNGVWTVEGSLPKGWNSGVALAEIDKQDGRILRVIHGK